MAVKVLSDGAQGFSLKVDNTNFTTSFFIKVDPENPHSHYTISTGEGALAKALQGSWTDPMRALAALKRYLSSAKETISARRENRYGPAARKNRQDGAEQGSGDGSNTTNISS